MINWTDSSEHQGDSRGRVAGCELGADIYFFAERIYLNIIDGGAIVHRQLMPKASNLTQAKREAENHIYQLLVDSQALQVAA